MIKEYLLRRATLLGERIRTNKERLEHNQIAIVESNNQIKELNDTIDEATQIFSVKAREDSGFKRQEISDLETRIAAYVSENKDYKEEIESTEKELNDVNKCLEELENINVSRETLDKTDETATSIDKPSKYHIEKDKDNLADDEDMKIIPDGVIIDKKTAEIVNKLKFCKSIAQFDGKRVSVEIDNIINLLKG